MSEFCFDNFKILSFVFAFSPKLAMTVVKKCGNARFFARNGRQLIESTTGYNY
jgi:hypothetical protein